MGKKNRKTRWRTLALNEDCSDSEDSNTAGPRVLNSKSYPKNPSRPYFSKYNSFSSQSTPTRRYQNDKSTRSSSTTSETKIIFNEDEYTRITTPRQDVLFKKGYLNKPKTYQTQTSTGNSTTSTGNSTGNGTPDHHSADGTEGTDLEYESPYVFPNAFVDQNGIYYINSYEPYPLVVYNPPVYYQDYPTPRSKRYSTDSMTESTSPNNEETSHDSNVLSDISNGHQSSNSPYNLEYQQEGCSYVNGDTSTSTGMVNGDTSEPRKIKKRRRRKSRSRSSTTATQECSSSEEEDLDSSEDEQISQIEIKPDQKPQPVDLKINEQKTEESNREIVNDKVGEPDAKPKFSLKADAKEFVPRASYTFVETMPIEQHLQYMNIPGNFVPIPYVNPMGDPQMHPAFLPPGIPINFIPPEAAKYVNFIPKHVIPSKAYNSQDDTQPEAVPETEEEISQNAQEQTQIKPETPTQTNHPLYSSKTNNKIDIDRIVSKLEEAAKEQRLSEGKRPYNKQNKFLRNTMGQKNRYQKSHEIRFNQSPYRRKYNEDKAQTNKESDQSEKPVNTTNYSDKLKARKQEPKTQNDSEKISRADDKTIKPQECIVPPMKEARKLETIKQDLNHCSTKIDHAVQTQKIHNPEPTTKNQQINHTSPKDSQQPLRRMPQNAAKHSPNKTFQKFAQNHEKDNHRTNQNNRLPPKNAAPKPSDRCPRYQRHSSVVLVENEKPKPDLTRSHSVNLPENLPKDDQWTSVSNRKRRKNKASISELETANTVEYVEIPENPNIKENMVEQPLIEEVVAQIVAVEEIVVEEIKEEPTPDSSKAVEVVESESKEELVEKNVVEVEEEVKASISPKVDSPLTTKPVNKKQNQSKPQKGSVKRVMVTDGELNIVSSSKAKGNQNQIKEAETKMEETSVKPSHIEKVDSPPVEKQKPQKSKSKKKKTAKNVSQNNSVDTPNSSNTNPDDSYEFLLGSTVLEDEKTNLEVSQELDKLIQRGMYSNLEEKMKAMNIANIGNSFFETMNIFDSAYKKLTPEKSSGIKATELGSLFSPKSPLISSKSNLFTPKLAEKPEVKSVERTEIDIEKQLDEIIAEAVDVASTKLDNNGHFSKEVQNSTFLRSNLQTNHRTIPDVVDTSLPLEIVDDSIQETTTIHTGTDTTGNTQNNTTETNKDLYPLTKAVKDWMIKTREKTPEIEILKSPNTIYKEFAEGIDESEEINQKNTEGNLRATKSLDGKVAEENDEEVTLYSRLRASRTCSREPSTEQDPLECWEAEPTTDGDNNRYLKPNNVLEHTQSLGDYQIGAKDVQNGRIEEGEDVLEAYESKYGKNEDFLKIKAEIEARKRGFPTKSDLPYKAICCNLM